MTISGHKLGVAANGRLNVGAAAEYLGVSVSTLNSWRSMGKGPRYVRLARKVVYRLADLEQFVEQAVVETTDSRGRDVG